MALARRTITHATVSANATSGTAPSNPIPDNCKEIVIYNSGSTNCLFRQVAAATVLSDDGNTGLIPAGGTKSFAIGQDLERASGGMDPAVSGATGLVFQMVSGTATIYIDYVNEAAGLRR
jgi:hypothetical protein